MAHKKRKDYEVAEVEHDVWECDFCDREIEDERNIHVFAVEPEMTFNPRKVDSSLVWLTKSEGRSEVEKAVELGSEFEGHICDKCLDDADLSRGIASSIYSAVIDKLRLH